MKITVEAVPTELIGTGCARVENFIYLNGEFEAILGYMGKVEIETEEGTNELVVKNENSNINYIKKVFESTEDVHFFFNNKMEKCI